MLPAMPTAKAAESGYRIVCRCFVHPLAARFHFSRKQFAVAPGRVNRGLVTAALGEAAKCISSRAYRAGPTESPQLGGRPWSSACALGS